MEEFSSQSGTWCPGCGDWAIAASIKRALAQLNFTPSDIMVVFGIGCSGNMNDVLKAYGLHSLHGRALPNAIGAKLAQHDKPVIAIVGDGDCYGEGGNHFMHAARGNHDITVVVHDNSVYGLTTGQVAPTALHGAKSKSTPGGMIEMSLNPLTLALTQGATFVGQGFAGEVPQLLELLKAGISHKGFSLVNVLQPCVTFNKVNTYEYYREKTYHLQEPELGSTDSPYDPKNFEKALLAASEMTTKERYPLGIIYQENRPSFTEQLPQLAETSLINRHRFTDFSSLLAPFK